MKYIYILIIVLFPTAMRDASMVWLWTPEAFKRQIEYHTYPTAQWCPVRKRSAKNSKDLSLLAPIWILLTQSDLSAWVGIYNLPKIYGSPQVDSHMIISFFPSLSPRFTHVWMRAGGPVINVTRAHQFSWLAVLTDKFHCCLKKKRPERTAHKAKNGF